MLRISLSFVPPVLLVRSPFSLHRGRRAASSLTEDFPYAKAKPLKANFHFERVVGSSVILRDPK